MYFDAFLLLFCLPLGIEDTVHVTVEHRPLNPCFHYFLRSFVFLFLIVLCQVCSLHQVRAEIFHISDWLFG